MRFVAAVLLLALGGCYASHQRASGPSDLRCDPVTRPTCVTRDAPCDPLRVVAPRCDDLALTWDCPDGASPHVEPWPDDRCLPLDGRAELVHEAPVPIAIGGACLWWLPALEIDRESRSHALVPIGAMGGGCTGLELSAAQPSPMLVTPPGADFVAVQGAITGAIGDPRPLVRGWVFDAAGGFGVRSIGVGLAALAPDGRFALPDPPWLFDPSRDLGDATLVFDGHAYAYGCPGDPEWLEEDCIVGRAPLAAIDDASAWSVLGARGWGDGDTVRVFGAGPHRSAVVHDPRGEGFLHVFAAGFATTLEIQRAPRPEGPWSPAEILARCELPEDDPDAYCAGPAVHAELHDPLRPGELIVSYSVGTLAPDGPARRAADPRAYWARVVRVPRP